MRLVDKNRILSQEERESRLVMGRATPLAEKSSGKGRQSSVEDSKDREKDSKRRAWQRTFSKLLEQRVEQPAIAFH